MAVRVGQTAETPVLKFTGRRADVSARQDRPDQYKPTGEPTTREPTNQQTREPPDLLEG